MTHVFQGQYLWLEASVSTNDVKAVKQPHSVPALAEEFARRERELKERWNRRILELLSNGKVALWGAGAKGVTFANLIDPERKWLDCVVDLNPQKQGHFLPGTGHPIVSYRELASRAIATVILMNPNYLKENLALLEGSAQDVRLIYDESQLVAD